MSIYHYDWIAHYARRRPEQAASVDIESGRRWTYRDLDKRIGQLAALLRDRFGVAQGDRIALLAPNSTDCFVVQFACWRLRAIFLPLNWRLAPRELSFILNDSETKILLHDAEFQEVAAGLRDTTPVEDTLVLTPEDPESELEAELARQEPLAVEVSATLKEVGTIMYTAGTTGKPKGALITHAMTLFNAINLSIAARVTRDSVHLVALPLFHTGGLNCYSNIVFHMGGTNLVLRNFTPEAGLELLTDRELGVTHFFGVPAHYQMLAQQPGFADAELNLVNAGVGGAPCPTAMLDLWGGKGVPMQQGYGLTETSPTALVLDTDRARDKIGSAGLPALHTELKLVSEDGEEITEPGALGEIWVRGPNVCPGYWKNPEADAAAFVDGWLRTGDAARQDEDGYYYIVDRWKDMFISGGENVYPAEVENVIYELDQVVEVAVVGSPDERWGEVGTAFVVRKSNANLSTDAIIAHCKESLAKYKVPKHVRWIDELPRNAAGKVLKPELRAML